MLVFKLLFSKKNNRKKEPIPEKRNIEEVDFTEETN